MIEMIIAFVVGVLAGGFGGYKIGAKAKAKLEAALADVEGAYNTLRRSIGR